MTDKRNGSAKIQGYVSNVKDFVKTRSYELVLPEFF